MDLSKLDMELSKLTPPEAARASREQCWRFALGLQKTRDFYRGRTKPAEDRLLNIVQFTALLQVDLVTLMEASMALQSESAQRVFGRAFAAHCYEAFEDLPELLGNGFDRDLRDVGVRDEELVPLNGCRVGLRALRATYYTKVKDIRDWAVSHRHKDAEAQLKLMLGFGADVYGPLSVAMLNWEAELFGVLNTLIAGVLGGLTRRCGRMDAPGVYG